MPTDHRGRPHRFWYAIFAIIALMVALYAHHLLTQQTPDPIAFIVPIVNFPVYWYGVVITSAIAFGCFVVARLVLTESMRAFEAVVPAAVRNRPLAALELSEQLHAQLQAKRVGSQGELLWQMGLNAKPLEISAEDTALLEERLQVDEAVDATWFRDAPWKRWNPEHVWNSVVWALIPGVIGARLYHVLTPQPSLGITPLYYLQNPMEMLNLRNGGLGIFGAIAGAVIGLLLYLRRQRLPLAVWLDLGAIAGALMQFVARWANYFNQELFGGITELPWGLYVDRLSAGIDTVVRFHPAFLYESLWSFATFLLLMRLWRRLPPGRVAAVYLICYGFGRILLETIRLDSNTTGGIPTASIVSAGMIAIGAIVLLIPRHK